MTMTIDTANVISLDGQRVARIGKNANLYGRGKHTMIYSCARGAMSRSHKIAAAVYVGGPSEWVINPAFEAEVRAAIA